MGLRISWCESFAQLKNLKMLVYNYIDLGGHDGRSITDKERDFGCTGEWLFYAKKAIPLCVQGFSALTLRRVKHK
jgi:hypothetical protein